MDSTYLMIAHCEVEEEYLVLFAGSEDECREELGLCTAVDSMIAKAVKEAKANGTDLMTAVEATLALEAHLLSGDAEEDN